MKTLNIKNRQIYKLITELKPFNIKNRPAIYIYTIKNFLILLNKLENYVLLTMQKSHNLS